MHIYPKQVDSQLCQQDHIYQWRIQDFPLGGRRPPTHTLFSKNICENKRNGSCWGGAHASGTPPGSSNVYEQCRTEVIMNNSVLKLFSDGLDSTRYKI